MLAVLNHRASAYEELHYARSKLMALRTARSGLFIKKRCNPFSSHTILNLLAEIAAAKLSELRLMLSLELFDKQLREETLIAKQHRIWLGSTKPQEPEPRRRPAQKLDGVTLFLLTSLWVRSLQKPRI